MKKRLLCATMCVIMLLTLTPNVFALKNGDVVDSVLHTDIVTYINDKPIESYNIKGYTAIKVEDLMVYGFQVAWNSAERTLKVTRPDNRAVTGNYTVVPNTYPVGSYWMDVYYTDIKTYFDGNEVPSYNIGGMTIAYVDDLAEYFAAPGKYIWDGAARTLSLTLRGTTGTSGSGSATATPAPTTPTTPAPAATPLTIISQPQNVNAAPNATVSFKVVAAGGTAPYTYKWELRSASDLVWTDAGCAEATYSFTASQSIIDKGYLFRCIVTDATGSGVYSEIAQLLGQAVVPLTIIADPADQIADSLYTALSFTVTAQGGVPAYTYEWQISTDGVNWKTTGMNNLQTYNLAVTPEMIASVMYVRCAVSDSAGQKAYSKAATVIGIAAGTAGTPGTGAGTPAPSTVTKSAVVNATVGVDFKQTFKYSDYGIPAGTASSEPTVNPTIEYGLKASFSSTELTIEGKPTKAGNANYRLSVTSGSTIYYLVINMVITASSSS
ncbi:MAG: hypothetical protein K6D94_08735, partial [Clostridiales bacterium]|nr:hypothetical protein [Clostridiales bacterium]